MLDPRRLLILDAVLTAGSMSGAALELRYSVAAVSQQIAALESEAGVSLLERQARGVVATAAGRVAGRHARLLAESLALAVEELDAVARGVSGSMRVSSFPAGSAALLPGPLLALAAERPDLDISVENRLPNESVAGVREGIIDLALVADLDSSARVNTDGLQSTELMRAGVSVMLPEHHWLAEREIVPLADLVPGRWIQGADAVCAAIVAKVALGHTAAPQITTHTTDITSTRGLVAAGLGAALVSELIDAHDTRGVVVRPLDPPVSHPVLIVTPSNPHQLPAAAALRQRLLDSPRVKHAAGASPVALN